MKRHPMYKQLALFVLCTALVSPAFRLTAANLELTTAPTDDCPPLAVRTLTSIAAWNVPDMVWKRNGDALIFRSAGKDNICPAILHAPTLQQASDLKIGLNNLMLFPAETNVGLHRVVISADLSPDENMLMIGTNLMEGGLGVARRSNLDLRTGEMRTRSETYGFWIWTADSKSWIGIGIDGRDDHLVLRRYRLSSQSTEELGDITDDLNLPAKKYVSPVLLRADSNARLTAAFLRTDAANNDVVPFAHIDFSHTPVKVTRFDIRLPESRIVRDIQLSPDGKRIAWQLYHTVQREDVFELWVSNADGGNMTRLGCIPLERFERRGVVDDPECLKWKPDNKHITFVLRGKLLEVSLAP